MTSISHCAFCKHAIGPGCDAFPDRVPSKIWLGMVPHDQPFPGDHGIMFEERDNLTQLDKMELALLQKQFSKE